MILVVFISVTDGFSHCPRVQLLLSSIYSPWHFGWCLSGFLQDIYCTKWEPCILLYHLVVSWVHFQPHSSLPLPTTHSRRWDTASLVYRQGVKLFPFFPFPNSAPVLPGPEERSLIARLQQSTWNKVRMSHACLEC